MSATVETSVSIPKTLFDRAKVLAQQLNLSQTTLFASAIEHFIRKHQYSILPDESNDERIQVNQAQPLVNEQL